jgi:GTP-binding protein EngB required for normal cell division
VRSSKNLCKSAENQIFDFENSKTGRLTLLTLKIDKIANSNFEKRQNCYNSNFEKSKIADSNSSNFGNIMKGKL